MHDVQHQATEARFIVAHTNSHSTLEYREVDGEMHLEHTFVPPEHRGQGIAERLTRSALAYAEQNGLTVVPTCSYVRKFIQRHPEFDHLVTDPSD